MAVFPCWLFRLCLSALSNRSLSPPARSAAQFLPPTPPGRGRAQAGCALESEAWGGYVRQLRTREPVRHAVRFTRPSREPRSSHQLARQRCAVWRSGAWNGHCSGGGFREGGEVETAEGKEYLEVRFGRDEAVRLLMEREAIRSCSRCGKTEFSVLGKFLALIARDDPDAHPSTSTQNLPVTRINCGYANLHASKVIGNDKEGDSDASK